MEACRRDSPRCVRGSGARSRTLAAILDDHARLAAVARLLSGDPVTAAQQRGQGLVSVARYSLVRSRRELAA